MTQDSMARIDPYKHEQRWLRWKQEQGFALPDLSDASAAIIRRFLLDMELGLNVSRSSNRGPRSFIRLNTLRVRIPALARKLRDELGVDLITEVTEEQVHTLINDMRTGVLRRADGEVYRAAADYVKDLRTFWHWFMEKERRESRTVPDIMYYLDARKDKPRWVYLTEDQVKRLCDEAKYDYRVLMLFLLDSGIRSPGELMNVRVCDFSDDFRRLNIREEVSKTFGRRINLMLCPTVMRDFIRARGFGGSDPVFRVTPQQVNKYLRRLGERVLGTEPTLAGEAPSKLSMYDFRHISACYWAVRYKSEAALKYRFGWTKTERIRYYTEFLGMADTIGEDDVLLEVEKTAVERRVTQTEKENELLRERLNAMQRQMELIAAAEAPHLIGAPTSPRYPSTKSRQRAPTLTQQALAPVHRDHRAGSCSRSPATD